MSESFDRGTRPLIDDQQLQDSQFTETDILEGLRDGSPRYGTFEGRNNYHTPVLPSRSQLPLVTAEPSMRTPLNTQSSHKRYRLSFLILISFDVTLVVFLSIICFLVSE